MKVNLLSDKQLSMKNQGLFMEESIMKKIITAVLAATVISSSAFACTPKYTSNVGSIMAQVRVQAAKAGAAVKNNDGNNPYLAAVLDAAAKAGAAAGAAVASGQ